MLYVSIDLETTGLDPNACQVIEFAAVIEDTLNPLPYEELPKFSKLVLHDSVQGELYAVNMNAAIFKELNDTFDAAANYINLAGITFKNFAQLLYNSARIGFNSKLNVTSGVPNLKNIKYDIFNTDTMTKSGNVAYDSTDKLYFGGNFDNTTDYTTYDEFSDTSVDTNLWTVTTGGGSSVTEDSSSQIITATIGSGSSSGSSESKILDLNTNNFLDITVLSYSCTTANSHVNNTATITISISGNTIFTKSATFSVLSVTGNNVRIQLFKNKNNGAVYYRTKEDSASWSSWGRLASGTQVKFTSSSYKGTSSGVNSVATMSISFVRYNTATDGTGTLISPITNTSSNVNDAFMTSNYLGSVNPQVTADGTNYEDISDIVIHRFTNNGLQLKTKFTFEEFSILSEYAVLYNTGVVI
jgi:hypothetical protein